MAHRELAPGQTTSFGICWWSSRPERNSFSCPTWRVVEACKTSQANGSALTSFFLSIYLKELSRHFQKDFDTSGRGSAEVIAKECPNLQKSISLRGTVSCSAFSNCQAELGHSQLSFILSKRVSASTPELVHQPYRQWALQHIDAMTQTDTAYIHAMKGSDNAWLQLSKHNCRSHFPCHQHLLSQKNSMQVPFPPTGKLLLAQITATTSPQLEEVKGCAKV